MIILLSFLWIIRTSKAILFWLYLWQIKEYHIGRFKAHFKTAKGKSLIFNKLRLLKIILLLGPILFASFFPKLLIVIYLIESTFIFRKVIHKKIIMPVLTKKTSVLISLTILLELLIVLFSFNQSIIIWFPWRIAFYLLLVDILMPLIVSLIVISFQPIVYLTKKQIIKKAKAKRAGFKDLLVIGITGSYGKTSVKEFLYTILSYKKTNILKTYKNENSEMGISRCILDKLKPEHKIFICEMGAYTKGGIKLLCDIAKPEIGILTGINNQHLATFGSQENIINTKFELIRSLPRDGIAVLNIDNQYISKSLIKNLDIKYKISYSINKKADIKAKETKIEKKHICFKVFYKNEDPINFKVNLLGSFNISNLLAAIAVAKKLGMTLQEISDACNSIHQLQSGIQLKKGMNRLNIFDATYSANPDSVISHLDYLKSWPGKKIIVMPCLIELGDSSKKIHKQIGNKIGEVCDLAIITTKDHFKELKGNRSNVLFIEKPEDIFKKIRNFVNPKDVILLESRVPNKLIKDLINSNKSIY